MDCCRSRFSARLLGVFVIIFENLQDRVNRIGGTDVSAIMGKNEYATREKIFLLKSGQIEDDFEGNKYTESGLLYESAVIKWYEYTAKESVMDPVYETEQDLLPSHTFVHPEYPFMVGSPDGLVRLNGRYKVSPHKLGLAVSGIKWGFEAKVTHYFGKKKWDNLEFKMPESYYLQCQYYMMITGIERWDLAVHHLTTADREIHRIDADIFLHEKMKAECLKFWSEVEEARKETGFDERSRRGTSDAGSS